MGIQNLRLIISQFLQEFWYTPHSYKKRAGGVIERRVQNWRRRLCEEDKVFLKKKAPVDDDGDDNNLMDQELVIKKEWLMICHTPEESVVKKMKETYPLRKNDCTKLTIKECFLQWPHLKSLKYVRY